MIMAGIIGSRFIVTVIVLENITELFHLDFLLLFSILSLQILEWKNTKQQQKMTQFSFFL